MPKSPCIHLIANSHIDPVWQWRWQEGCTEIRSTCRAACDFLSADAKLKFSRASAGDLRWLERCEPGLLRRMARLVRTGQWENVGGWWTQPDCNIPSGESFVRQALYGQEFFKKRLGGPAAVGYNVDSFGHNANLPQILAKCGIHYYVFMRPGPKQAPNIPLGYFHWEGVDGTRVMAFHILDNYTNNLQWQKEPLAAGREYLKQGEVRSAMYFYGMGDHGGGPTRDSLEVIERLRDEPDMPELVFSTTREAFASVEADAPELPVFRGELQIAFVGCYAAHSGIKALNRRAEEALLAAERMSVAASVLRGARYPAAALAEAWKDALQNQFHDILSGTALRAGYVDARDQFGRSIMTAEEALNAAQQSIAARVDTTRGDGQAILLFNPHPFPVTGYFETGNIITSALREIIRPERAGFFTNDGQQLPLQYVTPDVSAGSIGRYLFPVELPALGYRLYRIRQLEAPAVSPSRVQASERLLENDRLRVVVAENGLHITDRISGRVLVEGLQPLVIDDASNTWGSECERFDQVAGTMELVATRVLENGPLRATLRLEYGFGASKLWLDVLLSADERAIEFRGKAWWLEKLRILKLAIPVPGASESSMQEIPYAALQRPNTGKEWPIQQWADLSSPDAGVTLLNAGKYSMSVEGNQMRPTLLRATPYVWMFNEAQPWVGMKTKADWRDEDWMIDQGVEEFRLRAIFHDGDWRKAGVPEAARLFNRAPTLMMESGHRGALPEQLSMLQVEGGVRVEVLKRAEDGKGFILRAVETGGVHATARFQLHTPAVQWEAAFTPWEIKTFRIANGAARDEGMLEAL